MTEIGAGGVAIQKWQPSRRFEKDFRKLTPELQDLVLAKLRDLTRNPRPPGLRFEKLKGYAKPDVYTIHITGNCKLSMEIEGGTAVLRRVARHDSIDRRP